MQKKYLALENVESRYFCCAIYSAPYIYKYFIYKYNPVYNNIAILYISYQLVHSYKYQQRAITLYNVLAFPTQK